MKRLIVVLVVLGLLLNTTSSVAKRKWIVVKKLGNVRVSHYTPESNTPRGSRHTSSGRRARENHTIAVDYRHKAAKMYQNVRLWYKTKKKHRDKTVVYTVEDYGGFAKYGRDFDVFTCVSGQGVVSAQAEIVRKETKAEYKTRIATEQAAERAVRQKGLFVLKYDPKLEPNQIITDPLYIKSGCVSFGGDLFDVVTTKKGLGNTILCANKFLDGVTIRLEIVAEYAVG